MMLRVLVIAAAYALQFLMFVPAAFAGTAVLIWPLDPTIEAGRKAGTLWLENVGKAPVTLQIRVLAWEQRDFNDSYAAQSHVISTPPFTTIAPGKKQLVRLTLTAPLAAGEERAFRILVDEIPSPQSAGGVGLRVQMRYSLPLFAYGHGLWRKDEGRVSGAERARPALSWQLVEEGDSRYMQIRNSGSGHARLSQVRLVNQSRTVPTPDDHSIDIAPGLLGYVLPGQVMRWPVPAGELSGRQLQAQLETNAPPVTLS
ncbi:molecular chaperone, partial [Steroidobacter sp.]|uniref:fimbrial biogenesis chaperone n=1 Tax=Steroidobacter sp. TaxID=1978227 RepID=UPI001A412EFC